MPAPIEVAEPKRTLNKAARGPGRSSSEMPVKQPQYEQQNRQIDQEYGPPDHQQQSSPSPAPSNSRAPLMPRSVSNPNPNAGRPEPVSPSPVSASGDLATARPTMTRAPSSRDSYPPERPVAVSSYPKHDRGFEVTSRSHREADHRRRASSGAEGLNGDRPVSSASFDESDIFDAYSSLPSSNPGPVEWPGQDHADPAAPAPAPQSTTISPRKRGESLNAVKASGPYRTLSPTVELSPTHSSGETQAARNEVGSRRGQASVGGDARVGSAREYR